MATSSRLSSGESLRPGCDTTDAAAAVQLAAIRRRAPAERLRDALELSELMRSVALKRLGARYPELSPRELTERFLLEGAVRTDGGQ